MQAHLENIDRNVAAIQKKAGNRFTSLFNGVLSGFGSVIGAAIALAIIGWLLNAVGIIPAFKEEASRWQQLLQNAPTSRTVPVRGNQ